MITPSQVKDMQDKYKKDEALLKLCSEIQTLIQTPYYDMYLAMYKQINDWNKQIKDNAIDLYGTKELKEFDRVTKYFSDIQTYADKLDYLRGKMMPEDIQKANTEAKTPYEIALQEMNILK